MTISSAVSASDRANTKVSDRWPAASADATPASPQQGADGQLRRNARAQEDLEDRGDPFPRFDASGSPGE